MSSLRLIVSLGLIASTTCGCTPAQTPTSTVAPPTASASASVASADPRTEPSAAPAASDDPSRHELVRASSHDNPVRLEVILPDNKPASEFPKQTEPDDTCWKTVELIGDHDKDYEALLRKCGEATGMLVYTRPVESRLHDIRGGDKKDPRDFYAVRVREGMCYRFYAVADQAMVDLDMHVYKGSGALVGTVETRSPALIMQSRAVLCPDFTEDWVFELDVNANGTGRYKFAVWTRPARNK